MYSAINGLIARAALPPASAPSAAPARSSTKYHQYFARAVGFSQVTSAVGYNANGSTSAADRIRGLRIMPTTGSKDTAEREIVHVVSANADPLLRTTAQVVTPMADPAAIGSGFDVVVRSLPTVLPNMARPDSEQVAAVLGRNSDGASGWGGLYVRMSGLAYYMSQLPVPPAGSTYPGVNWAGAPAIQVAAPTQGNPQPPNYSPMITDLISVGAATGDAVFLPVSLSSRVIPDAVLKFIVTAGSSNLGINQMVAGVHAFPGHNFPEALPIYFYGPGALLGSASSAAVVWADVQMAFRIVSQLTGDADSANVGHLWIAGLHRFMGPEVTCLGMGLARHRFPGIGDESRTRAQLTLLGLHYNRLGVATDVAFAGRASMVIEAGYQLAPASVTLSPGDLRILGTNMHLLPAGPMRMFLRIAMDLETSNIDAVLSQMTTWEVDELLRQVMVNGPINLLLTNAGQAKFVLDPIVAAPVLTLDATAPALGVDGRFSIQCAAGLTRMRHLANAAEAATVRRLAPGEVVAIPPPGEFAMKIRVLAAAMRAHADGVIYGTKSSGAVREAARGEYNTGNADLDEILPFVGGQTQYNASAILALVSGALTARMEMPDFIMADKVAHDVNFSMRASLPTEALDMAFPPYVQQLLISYRFTVGGLQEGGSRVALSLRNMPVGRDILGGIPNDQLMAQDQLGFLDLAASHLGRCFYPQVSYKVESPQTRDVVTAQVLITSLSGARPTDFTPHDFGVLAPRTWWLAVPYTERLLVGAVGVCARPMGNHLTDGGRTPGMETTTTAANTTYNTRLPIPPLVGGYTGFVTEVKKTRTRASTVAVPPVGVLSIQAITTATQDAYNLLAHTAGIISRGWVMNGWTGQRNVQSTAPSIVDYRNLWIGEGTLPADLPLIMGGGAKPAAEPPEQAKRPLAQSAQLESAPPGEQPRILAAHDPPSGPGHIAEAGAPDAGVGAANAVLPDFGV